MGCHQRQYRSPHTPQKTQNIPTPPDPTTLGSVTATDTATNTKVTHQVYSSHHQKAAAQAPITPPLPQYIHGVQYNQDSGSTYYGFEDRYIRKIEATG